MTRLVTSNMLVSGAIFLGMLAGKLTNADRVTTCFMVGTALIAVYGVLTLARRGSIGNIEFAMLHAGLFGTIFVMYAGALIDNFTLGNAFLGASLLAATVFASSFAAHVANRFNLIGISSAVPIVGLLVSLGYWLSGPHDDEPIRA